MDRDAMLDEYLRVCRALGVGLVREEKLLRQFLGWLEEHGHDRITEAVAIDWVRLPGEVSSGWLGMRMNAVRGFAGFCRTLDGATEVPARGVLSGHGRRAIPYLFSDTDIDALCRAAETFRGPARVATYQVLVRLLAVTGMRIGEAAALDTTDADVEVGILTVTDPKYGRTRLLPLHNSTVSALLDYRNQITAVLGEPDTPALLVSGAGTRLHVCNIGAAFRRMVAVAGLEPRSSRCRPRPHDLRHTFAVRTLIDWFNAGEAIEAKLPLLSAWLGHASPANTYWYLHAAPELMTAAAERLHTHRRDEP